MPLNTKAKSGPIILAEIFSRDCIPYGLFQVLSQKYENFWHDTKIAYVREEVFMVTYPSFLTQTTEMLEIEEVKDFSGIRRIRCAYCEGNDTLYIYPLENNGWL